MKLIDNIKLFASAGILAALLFGCKKEELKPANAVAAEYSTLTFEAVGAESQDLPVYADGYWNVECDEQWVEFSTIQGYGSSTLKVYVQDNLDNNVMDLPRKAKVYLRGGSSDPKQNFYFIVEQKGDKYKGVKDITVTEAVKLEDGRVARVPDAQVLAKGTKAFIVSDGTSHLVVLGEAEVKPGDQISFNGEKGTSYGVPVVTLDELVVKASGTAVYPDAKVVDIDTYEATTSEFIQVEGSLVGSTLRFAGKEKRLDIVYPTSELNLSSVDIHKLVVRGFYAGVVDKNTKNKAIIAVDYQDKGMDESLVPYPVKWAVGAGAKEAGYLNYTTDSWAATNSIEAIQGLGTISYIPACTNPIDFLLPWTPEMEDLVDKDGKLVSKGNLVDNGNKKFARDINGSDIRIVGTWPGDFWLFTGTGAIKAGSKVQIKFESRVSGTNHMFWQVEYYDGGNWKIAGDYQETDVTGTKITYTHSMNPDASTNVKVNPIVTFNHNNDHCYFRFRCMANWQTNGKGPLAARNGGTGRISVNDVTEAGVEWWPSITIIEEGDGVDRPDTDPVMANIITTPDYLTFEGTPEGPKTISISSDYDFTVSATADWLSLDVNQGVKGEKTAVKVTCEPSSSSKLREAALVIVSADSKKTVPVIQSAAGGQLDPLISVSANKNISELLGEGDEFTVAVQSNIDYEIEISDDWITEVEVPATKALVEKTYRSFKVSPNVSGSARSGYVRFFNDKEGVEAYAMVKQANFVPRVDISASSIYLGVPGIASTITFAVDANVNFTISSDADWITFPAAEAKAGIYEVPVSFAANSGEARSATVTITNVPYSYEKTLTINQFASGILFADDFTWLKPVVDKAKETTPGDYDTVGNHNLSAKAPNIYATADLNALFVPLRDAIGYYIPGKADGANNVVYLQEYYLKMGKTKTESQTSLTLPAIYSEGKDYTVSFDWARMEQGSGSLDDYTLTLVISGEGTFENGTKYSDELSTPQQKGEMFWTTVSAIVKGANKDTRITMVATSNLDKTTGKIDYTKSGGKRMFIDNIVVKAK